jgi:hypothetical protein
MARKINITVPKSPSLNLSHIWDNPDPVTAQKAHDALTPDVRQKLTSALQNHLNPVAPDAQDSQGQKALDPANNPPSATPPDSFGQKAVVQQQNLSNISGGEGPDTTVAGNPMDTPAKTPAAGPKLGSGPDFSGLGS